VTGDTQPDDLTRILDEFDARSEVNEAQERQQQERRDEFTEQFDVVVREVVKPVLNELAEQLTARGHEAEVVEQAALTDVQGRPISGAQFKLVFRSRGHGRPDESLRSADRGLRACDWGLTCDSSQRRVEIGESTMEPGHAGRAGRVGSWELDEVTHEAVRQSAIRLIGEALTPPRR
jgi:hypothetical protein